MFKTKYFLRQKRHWDWKMLKKIKTPEVACSAWLARFLDCCVRAEAPWLEIKSKREGFRQNLGIGLVVYYTLICFIFPFLEPRSDHNVFPCLSVLTSLLICCWDLMMWLWRLKTLIMYILLLIKLEVFDVWVVVLMAILFIKHNMFHKYTSQLV